MWEILARKVPWSWLQKSTVKQALCEDEMSLPMFEIWPSYVQSIMKECLQNPGDRPAFGTVREYLFAIKNRGEGLTSEVLDGAFPDWYEFQCGVVHRGASRERNLTVGGRPLPGTSRSSEIHVMLRRSSSGAYWNSKRRSTSVQGGLKDILKVMTNQAQDSPREKEIERFGYEIAKRLAFVRCIRRHARNYGRSSWAKEVVFTRALEGDIERIKKEEKKAKSSKKNRHQLSQRGRRYSVFDEEGFESLQMTSSKYMKKDWAKILHGMEKLKNSMEGFKEQVFEELKAYERQQVIDNVSVSEHNVTYEEIEMVKGAKGDIEKTPESQALDGHSAKDKTNKQELTLNTAGLSKKAELLEPPHRDSSSSIYAQSDKIRQKAVKKELTDPKRERDSTVEKVLDTEVGNKFEESQPEMSKDEMTGVASNTSISNQEKSKVSDSHIYGSSSHGMYAISDFLRDTESFRNEHLENIALRSHSNSIQSTIVPGSKQSKTRRSSFSNRPRAQSAGQIQSRTRARTVLSSKEGTSKDKIVLPSSYKDSSHNGWAVRVDRSQRQQTERLRSNSEDVSDFRKSFYRADCFRKAL